MANNCIGILLFLIATVALAGDDPKVDKAERERLRELQSLPYVSPAAQATGEQRTGVVGIRADSVAPGLNLYANRFRNRAFLMTNTGRILHEWSLPDRSSWLDVEALPDGTLLV